MNCPEPIFDRKTKKTRICNKEIFGVTGLEELLAFQKRLRKNHRQKLDISETLKYRAESEQ